MRRCGLFRGSNTWRIGTTRREQAVRHSSAWSRGEVTGEGGIALSIERRNYSVQTGVTRDNVVKNSAVNTLSDNVLLRPNSDAYPPDFPLSPLMDPEYQQAKQRYRAPKESPTGPGTQLQQELAKNPFARALATPLRECGMNKILLPRYFLQDYKMISHPTTEVPYLMPTCLTSKEEKRPEPIMGLTGYTLANKHAIATMLHPDGGYSRSRAAAQRAHIRTLIPKAMLGVKPLMDELSKSRWRPDMDEFVLELLRRRCVEYLVQLADLKRGYLVGCQDWEDAVSKPSVGAYLWTGDENGSEDFATLDLGMEGGLKGGEKKRKRKVPVYSLTRLLGPEKLTELRKQLPNGVFDRDVVVVKHKNMTVKLQMQLWKLQGYIADFSKLMEAGKVVGVGSIVDEVDEDVYDEEKEEDDGFFGDEDFADEREDGPSFI